MMMLMGQCDKVLTRIGNAGTSGFADHPNRFSGIQCLQKSLPDLYGVLVCRRDTDPFVVIDLELGQEFFQKPSRCSFFFHKKELAGLYSLFHVSW